MRTEAPLVFAQGEFFQLEVIYKENPSLLTSIEHIFFCFELKIPSVIILSPFLLSIHLISVKLTEIEGRMV